MFKKKANTITRPKPPTSKHILEDLSNAPHEDPVFNLMNKINIASYDTCERRKSSELNDEASDPARTKRSNGPSQVYDKVKSFVKTNNELKVKMQRLQEQNEALHISDLELKTIAQDIRKQALDALK